MVSIIIPSYNCAEFLPESIDSVLNQTYKDFEIIVVDDGSIDNTRDAIKVHMKKYGGRIRYLYQDNRGPAAARNKGIEEAKGDFIAFLDADDLWDKEKLAKTIAFLKKGDFDWVATASKKITMEGSVLEKRKIKAGTYGYNSTTGEFYDLQKRLFSYRFNLPTHVQTFVVKKLCFEKAGLFDKSILINEDIDLTSRFQRAGLKGGFLNEMLTTYRFRATSITKNKTVDSVNQSYQAVKKYIKEFGLKNPTIRKDYASFLWEIAGRYYVKNKIFHALKFAILSFTHHLDITKMLKMGKYFGRNMLHKGRGKTKILFYEPSSGFGGSGNNLASLVNHLDRNKFYPIIVIKNEGPQFKKIQNSDFIKLRIGNIVSESIKLYLIIRNRNISLVHINTNIISGIPAIISSKIAGIPCISHIRQCRRLIKREQLLSKWVHKVIVLSKDAYKLYKNFIPEKKLLLIYDGVSLDGSENIIKTFRQEYNLQNNPSVGVIGRIVEGKGQKEYIYTAKEVLKRKPNVKFIITGDAKGGHHGYYKEIKQLVEREGLRKSVIFTGWRNDVKNIISELDILVLSSTTFAEGLPNTIIDAMALGKPVIATDIAGPNEMVVDGKTGFLVPPGDIKVMAEKIIYLLDNSQIAKRMGKEGRKRVEEKFNIKDAVKMIEDIYCDILLSKANRKLKKTFAYNIHGLFDLALQPLRFISMYRAVKKFEKNEAGLQYKKERLLGEIDQDSRLLSFVGKLSYLENVTKKEFLPRVRYKLQLVTLRHAGQEIVAIKKYFDKDKSGFIKEAFMLNRLSSCNVPKILKVDAEKNIIYMSFILGVSLRDALWAKGAKVKDIDYIEMRKKENVTNQDVAEMKLSEGKEFIMQVVDEKLARKICAQLNKIHSKGIILDDTKYGNIIISKNNEPFFIDFHSAKIIASSRNVRAAHLVQQEMKNLKEVLC